MNEKICGIYQILNTSNGKCYIGSSVNIKTRWKNHVSALRKNKSQNIKLQNAWNKHGEMAFEFNIIEIVYGDKECLYKREQHYIDLYDSARRGYNILAAAGSSLGYKHTEETRIKLSESHKGIKLSDETKKKLSEAKKGENHHQYGKSPSAETLVKKSVSMTRVWNAKRAAGERHPMYGRHHTEETKSKLSESAKNRYLEYGVSAETREKISKAISGENHPMYGKHHSEESREKMSESKKGTVLSPETCAKLSELRKRENLSEETLRKMSESATGRKLGAESRAKISKANTGKVRTPEARAKMSEVHKRENLSPEKRARLSEAAKKREERKRLAKTIT